MLRKYPVADIVGVIVILLDIAGLYLLNGFSVWLLVASIVAACVAIFIAIYKPATLESMIRRFDINVIITVTFFLASAIRGFGYFWVMPAVVSCLICLICIVFMRMDVEMIKGKVLTIIILLAVVALAVLLTMSVASSAGGLIVEGAGLVGSLISFIAKQLWRLAVWFASLFPQSQTSGGESNIPSYDIELPEEGEVSEKSGIAALIILAALIALAVYFLIRFIIEHGLPKLSKVQRSTAVKRKKSKFSFAMHALFTGLVYKFKMLVYMTKNTALAKYYRIVYSKRLTPDHKKKSETPREFLSRIPDIDTDFILEVERRLYR